VDFVALLAHSAAAARVVSAAPQDSTVEPVLELLPVLGFPRLDGQVQRRQVMQTIKYYFGNSITALTQAVVTVTKKGQATIPIELRKKHKIGRKVLVIDTDAGVLLKPVADPIVEKGSLKKLFASSDSRELIEEARFTESQKERASKQR